MIALGNLRSGGAAIYECANQVKSFEQQLMTATAKWRKGNLHMRQPSENGLRSN
jgi:hypothetical protein